jgi:membrane protease YdiL (CAAX protease family)
VVGSQFDVCWNCETSRAGELDSGPVDEPAETAEYVVDSATASATPPPAELDDLTSGERFELRLEVVVALCVVWVPYFLSGVIGYLAPAESVEWPFLAESLWQISGFVPGVAVILYLIYRGNTPWQVHGLRRPKLVLDTVSGFLIWMASLLAVVLMQRISTLAAGAERWTNEPPSTYGFAIPSTTTDYVMLLALSIAIGFSEELAMRSYLIPRFERLFRSTAKAVLLSSALFAGYHLYQGFESAFSIFFIGLVYGVAFCLTRRFWPVAIAHAMNDFSAIGATGMP